MMRVAFHTMQFGAPYYQGTERYLERLVGGFTSRAWQVHILAGDPQNENPPQHANLASIPSNGWFAVEGVAGERIQEQLDAFQPDVIHLLNPAHVGLGITQIARRRRIPYVITTMDYWWVCPTHTLLRGDGRVCGGRRPWRECAQCIAQRHASPRVRAVASLPIVGKDLSALGIMAAARRRGVSADERARWRDRGASIREALAGARAVIYPSAAAEEIIGSAYPQVRGVRIPYGVEQCWFDVRRAEPPRADPNGLRIGYAGALAPHKGVRHLLEAVRDLDWTGAEVRLAGGGDRSYIRRLRSIARGLSVEFLGRMGREQMCRFFAEIDVLVVPSVWPENMPVVMLEAAAAGTPVLASDVAGHREHVTDVARFAPGSSASLAEALDGWFGRGRVPPVPEQPISAEEMIDRTIRMYEVGATAVNDDGQ